MYTFWTYFYILSLFCTQSATYRLQSAFCKESAFCTEHMFNLDKGKEQVNSHQSAFYT